MKKIKTGDTVKVNYTGRLEDGSVFDTSLVEGREPLQVTLGQGQLIKGFENGLIDMTEGENKTVTIEVEDAYGPYQDYMVEEVEKERLPGEVEVGTPLQAQTQMGPINFVVKEIKENTVILDGNHPLAGQKLIFDLEVVEIN